MLEAFTQVLKSKEKRECKSAYKRLALQYHPDKSAGKYLELFKSIVGLWELYLNHRLPGDSTDSAHKQKPARNAAKAQQGRRENETTGQQGGYLEVDEWDGVTKDYGGGHNGIVATLSEVDRRDAEEWLTPSSWAWFIKKWNKKQKSGFLHILTIFENKHFEYCIHFNKEGNRR